MQRSTLFLVALFVVAVAASAAIKFQFTANRPDVLDRSARADTQADRSSQVSNGESTWESLPDARGAPDNHAPVDEASPTSGEVASARPLPGTDMRQSDLEVRATSDASLVVRFKAVQGLSAFASSSAVQTLSKVLLTDPAMRVRLAAIQSLVDIAKANPDLASEVRAALQAVADDPDNNVSVVSRQAMSEIQ